MTPSEPSDSVKTVVAKELISAARSHPSMQRTGAHVANSLEVVARTINNALLPLAALNFGIEKAKQYFDERFAADVERHTAGIPRENLTEPRPAVAGPLLQGLAFAHEEEPLREMFLSLLAASMDAHTKDAAHPSFAEIIKQLSAEEAVVLSEILTDSVWPIVKLELHYSGVVDGHPIRGSYSLRNHVLDLRDENGATRVVARLPIMVDNWVRLGLVSVDYVSPLAKRGSYDWLEGRPEYNDLPKEGTDYVLKPALGMLSLTDFGKEFALVVLKSHSESAGTEEESAP